MRRTGHRTGVGASLRLCCRLWARKAPQAPHRAGRWGPAHNWDHAYHSVHAYGERMGVNYCSLETGQPGRDSTPSRLHRRLSLDPKLSSPSPQIPRRPGASAGNSVQHFRARLDGCRRNRTPLQTASFCWQEEGHEVHRFCAVMSRSARALVLPSRPLRPPPAAPHFSVPPFSLHPDLPAQPSTQISSCQQRPASSLSKPAPPMGLPTKSLTEGWAVPP